MSAVGSYVRHSPMSFFNMAFHSGSIVDAHCHLQDERLLPHMPGAFNTAIDSGIGRFVCCGTRPSDWFQVRQWANKSDTIVFPTFGIHPWYVNEVTESSLESLSQYISEGACAVGEIGLDFAIRAFDKSRQLEFFSLQLELAKQYGLPVVVHCRKAWSALISILDKHAPLTGLIHCYSGGPHYIHQLEALGMYLSFGGPLTRSRNKKGRNAFCQADRRRILIETDAPDLVPIGCGVDLNFPVYIHKIIDVMSELLSIPQSEVIQLTNANACRLFKWT